MSFFSLDPSYDQKLCNKTNKVLFLSQDQQNPGTDQRIYRNNEYVLNVKDPLRHHRDYNNASVHTLLPFRKLPLHKKLSFPLRISSVNVTKFAGNRGFGNIYWRYP